MGCAEDKQQKTYGEHDGAYADDTSSAGAHEVRDDSAPLANEYYTRPVRIYFDEAGNQIGNRAEDLHGTK
jgi:hypothetical protein